MKSEACKNQLFKSGLKPPPVILVHGMWGDKESLGGEGGAGEVDGLARYLKQQIPWAFHPEFVEVLCYSKYFGFDATADPLSRGSTDPCEKTSEDAIFKTIRALIIRLDDKHFVGARVNVVAHSMGGLAARWYASQKSYRYLRNRKKGEFHEIITLDTPELGSELARSLIDYRYCKGQVLSPGSDVWNVFCFPLSIDVATLAACFRLQGMPLAKDPDHPGDGAVYSLYPPNKPPYPYGPPALQKRGLSSPNIAGADWRAVSAVAPDKSKLKFLLNSLISAIYPQNTGTWGSRTCRTSGSPPTVDTILKDSNNDAVVTVRSQLDMGVQQPNHSYTFERPQGLSHIGLDVPSWVGWVDYVDDNVEDSPDV